MKQGSRLHGSGDLSGPPSCQNTECVPHESMKSRVQGELIEQGQENTRREHWCVSGSPGRRCCSRPRSCQMVLHQRGRRPSSTPAPTSGRSSPELQRPRAIILGPQTPPPAPAPSACRLFCEGPSAPPTGGGVVPGEQAGDGGCLPTLMLQQASPRPPLTEGCEPGDPGCLGPAQGPSLLHVAPPLGGAGRRGASAQAQCPFLPVLVRRFLPSLNLAGIAGELGCRAVWTPSVSVGPSQARFNS